MSTKVGRGGAPAPRTLTEDLQSKLINDGHLDLDEVRDLKKGWGKQAVTFEQAREFRQAVLGGAKAIQPEARKELQRFIEEQLPKLTAAADPNNPAPRDFFSEVQVKALGDGRIDLAGTRELLAGWSSKPMSADDAQNLSRALVNLTGTFESREARFEVQRFITQTLPTLITGPDTRARSFDDELRIAAMDDGHIDAVEATLMVERWKAGPKLSVSDARQLESAVTRSASFIDPGGAREAFRTFIDCDLAKLTPLAAPRDGGVGPITNLQEALQAKLQPDSLLDDVEVFASVGRFGRKPVTAQQARDLRQMVLNNAPSIQPEGRKRLQHFLTHELPRRTVEDPNAPVARAPVDDLRLAALGTGSISTAGAQELVQRWSAQPTTWREADQLARALLENTGLFESNEALSTVRRFVQDELPGMVQGPQVPRDLGRDLLFAMADDGRVSADDARKLVELWRAQPSISNAQAVTLNDRVTKNLEAIDPGAARDTLLAFVKSELASRVAASPKSTMHIGIKGEQPALATAAELGALLPAEPPPSPPKNFLTELQGKLTNDGHLDLKEVTELKKAWADKPMTAAVAQGFRQVVLSEAPRIQPDARQALQRFIETQLPGLTADDPATPSAPPYSQQLEIKALGRGKLSLDDARALVQHWGCRQVTAQDADQMADALAGNASRFANNEALAEMKRFVTETLPGLVKDPQNVQPSYDRDLRIARMPHGTLTADSAERVVQRWSTGGQLRREAANQLRAAVNENLSFVAPGKAQETLKAFVEDQLPKLTLPTIDLDVARAEPKSLLEGLVAATGAQRMDRREYYGQRPIDEAQVTALLARFGDQPVTAQQARELEQTVVGLSSSIAPAGRQALQRFVEERLPRLTAHDPKVTLPRDPRTELAVKALGSGSLTKAAANELVRSWQAQPPTAEDARKMTQALVSSAGLFESNEAIRVVQRFVQRELPGRVIGAKNVEHNFFQDLSVATIDDGHLDARDVGHLIDAWKELGPLDVGQADQLIASVLGRSQNLDPGSAGRQMRSFLEKELPIMLKKPQELAREPTRDLRIAALEHGQLNGADARHLVDLWKKQKSFTPDQASALVEAVLNNAQLVEPGRAREVLQGFIEKELPQRTQPGPDGEKARLTPERELGIRELTGGQINLAEAQRVVATWNDPKTTPAMAESMRRAVAKASFDPKASGEIKRFVDERMPKLIVGQALTSPNSVELAWDPPVALEDGSLLVDLIGYKVEVGSSPGRVDQTLEVTDPAATGFEITSLTPGPKYFRVRAVRGDRADPTKQAQSVPSSEVSKTIK